MMLFSVGRFWKRYGNGAEISTPLFYLSFVRHLPRFCPGDGAVKLENRLRIPY